jgi:hypothetical protein
MMKQVWIVLLLSIFLNAASTIENEQNQNNSPSLKEMKNHQEIKESNEEYFLVDLDGLDPWDASMRPKPIKRKAMDPTTNVLHDATNIKVNIIEPPQDNTAQQQSSKPCCKCCTIS